MQIKWLVLFLSALFFLSGCKHLSTAGGAASSPQAFQISANAVDAAEPATAAAPDGSFYVAWVNHEAKQADVMLARFTMRAGHKVRRRASIARRDSRLRGVAIN